MSPQRTEPPHEVSCTWVPGTLDIVRARIGSRVIEVTSTTLARVFGPRALDDLYLKGRVTMPVSPQQLSLLA
ncbi:hypothetical protein [Deinococcus ficus]|uniref:hypothetical protein n=1 Tax=Deinococcus ficus TaxID=317577 RepID=UPI0017492581|nr:hypothetical protein [Deinococcus ficus]GHF84177.1 hypothetical protein GCM10017782_22140 [Deinococcus ficus]